MADGTVALSARAPSAGSRSRQRTGARDVPANMDSLRATACILLVMFHAIGSTPANGLRLPAESGWHTLTASFDFVRMPIFTVLSGYLYACRRADRAGLARLLGKRLRRIGIPLVAGTLVTLALRAEWRGDDTGFVRALTHGYQHFWFLQAILIDFALVTAIDAVRQPGPAGLAMLCALAAILSNFHPIGSTLFSINGAVYLLPFFLFGTVVRTAPALMGDRAAALLAALLAGIVLTWQQMALAGTMPPIAKTDLAASIGSMAVVLLMLRFVPPIGWLARLGATSFPIYLWHPIACSAAQQWLVSMGVRDVPVLLATSLVAGLALPTMAAHGWAAAGRVVGQVQQRSVLSNA